MGVYQVLGIICGIAVIILFCALWCAVKPEWLDRNLKKIIFFMGIIFLIQGGVTVYRFPHEFRTSVMPKLLRITDYENRINKELEELDGQIDAKVDIRYQRMYELVGGIVGIVLENKQRVNSLCNIPGSPCEGSL